MDHTSATVRCLRYLAVGVQIVHVSARDARHTGGRRALTGVLPALIIISPTVPPGGGKATKSLAARRTFTLLALSVSLAISARAAEDPLHDPTQDLWQSDETAATPSADSRTAKHGRKGHRLKRLRTLRLDPQALAAMMADAPPERSRAARERPLVLSLPAPDGGFERFAVHLSPVMEPGLAARHPEIKTYSGRGLDHPATTIRFDLSPLGLHASVRGPEGAWYVDPTVASDPGLYRTYFGRDLVDNPHGPLVESEVEIAEISTDRGYYHPQDTVTLHGAGFVPLAPIVVTIFASDGTFGPRTVDAVADARGAFDLSFVADPGEYLGTHGLEAADGTSSVSSAYDVVSAEDKSVDPPVGDQLRTYRLALLSDDSYADYFGAANVTAAKVSLVNRLTHVYEAETAIRLVLIAGNDVLNLNTRAQMRGLSGPCGGGACFSDTQATSCGGGTLTRIRQVIGLLVGASNYDIGHMVLGVTTAGGSSLGVVGGNNKAMGCTGIESPVGDRFAVDFVAHEMGHQFSANHVFNGTLGACAASVRNAPTSVEPGSGSSIMGFAGMCQADDLQAHSDPYWAPRSFDEVTNFVAAPEANITEVQMVALTGFDGTDSFRLRYNGNDSAPIVRGTNFTAAGIQTAIRGIAGWPAFAIPTVSLAADASFMITFGGSLASMDVSPFAVVSCSGCTGFVGEIAKGGATNHQGVVTATGNSYPMVTAPAQFTIPLRTPFALTGSATDPDGDPLTYTWEQNDRGGSMGTPLLSNAKANGPLFRQFETAAVVSKADALQYQSPGENAAGSSPTRVFPNLGQILANRTNAETGTCPAGDVDCFSEFLPTAAYVGFSPVNASPLSLHFRLTARDGRADGGGVNTATTTLLLATNAGPFLVTSPSAAVAYPGGSAQMVTWDVANTNLAPVAAAEVRITLSVDGGRTYPYELAASTPNDGSEAVLLPNVSTSQARVKVEAVGNVFFDVSNADFAIQALPTVTSSAPAGAVVQYSDSLSPPVSVLASDADSAGSALTVSATGLPVGLSLAAASVSGHAERPGSATWVVTGRVAAAPGTYNVAVVVTDDTAGTASTFFTIVVTEEDAEATYAGEVLAFTSSIRSTAPVLLRATVREGAEGSAGDTETGDIANARVTFKEGDTILCEDVGLALLDGASAAASCNAPLWPGAHKIDIEVGRFYRGAGTTIIEVSEPEGSFVSGGGAIVSGRSAGAYAADSGSLLAFALNLKYKPRGPAAKDPQLPKGHVEVLFRAGGRSYAVKSHDIALLGVSEETASGQPCHGRGPRCVGRADMRWTARLLDVTKGFEPTIVASDLALQVTVTDNGDHHGSGDSIGITLWDGDRLLLSSAWTATRTLEQVLKTGKITVN